MLVIEVLLAPWERVRRPVHLAVIGVLGSGVALRFLDHLAAGPGGLPIAPALVLGAGFAWLYDRRTGLRQALTLLSPSPVLVLGVFLVLSPVHKLVLPQK